MKIYTKTGDTGKTSLFGGQRVSKSHIRVDAYGTVDELNSYLGLIRDQEINIEHKEFLINIQNQLFVVGAFLATPNEDEFLKNEKSRLKLDSFGDHEIKEIESKIDELELRLPQLTNFVLPGGHISVSHCHIARAICRRAERICVLLNQNTAVTLGVISYLNRLSDYLFVLARMLSKELKADEIKWIPSKQK